MGTFRGQEGLVKIGTSAIGEMKSFEVNTVIDAIDVTPKGTPWRKKKPGLKGWSGRATVQYDPADAGQVDVWTKILDADEEALTPTMIFYPGGAEGGGVRNGPAVITGHNVTSPEDSSVVTLEITFDGAGPLASGEGA